MEKYKDHYYVETLYEIIPELKTAKPGKLQSQKLPKLKNIIMLGDTRHPGTWKISFVEARRYLRKHSIFG